MGQPAVFLPLPHPASAALSRSRGGDGGEKKRPQGESNPCHHLERVVSLPLDDGGQEPGTRNEASELDVIAVTGFEPVFQP